MQQVNRSDHRANHSLKREKNKTLLILGGGYTGRVIFRQAASTQRSVLISSRNPEKHLTGIPPQQRVFFDLLLPETWEHIPAGADLIWTFPPIPLDKVIEFIKTMQTKAGRMVVLGSTSAYRVEPARAPEIIDEKSAIDPALPRVQGEEFLRETLGAVIVRSAGIYGPGRNPLEWIRQGKIGYSDRILNLIHVEDLAGICLRALERGKPGEVYIASDGLPRRCSDLIDATAEIWNVQKTPSPEQIDQGKQLSNQKVIKELEYLFRYPDLLQGLKEIEAQK
jgi:hypothetical protein